MNNKKGISAIVATVLIILITVAAVTIIWAAIIPMIQDQLDTESYNIYLNGTEVYGLTIKVVSSVEMITSGKYPDYLMCFSYCANLAIQYNDTSIFRECNGECIAIFGVNETRSSVGGTANGVRINRAWLDVNCIKNSGVSNLTSEEYLNYQCEENLVEVGK